MTEYVYPTSSLLLRKYRQTVNHVEEHICTLKFLSEQGCRKVWKSGRGGARRAGPKYGAPLYFPASDIHAVHPYAFSKIIFLIQTLKYYTDMIDNIGGTA